MSCNRCGTPYTNLDLCGNCSAAQAYKDKVADIISELVSYAWPGRDRGPAYSSWIAIMKKTADLMGWATCSKCDGTGEVPVVSEYRTMDCCGRCYGVGKDERKDEDA